MGSAAPFRARWHCHCPVTSILLCSLSPCCSLTWPLAHIWSIPHHASPRTPSSLGQSSHFPPSTPALCGLAPVLATLDVSATSNWMEQFGVPLPRLCPRSSLPRVPYLPQLHPAPPQRTDSYTFSKHVIQAWPVPRSCPSHLRFRRLLPTLGPQHQAPPQRHLVQCERWPFHSGSVNR